MKNLKDLFQGEGAANVKNLLGNSLPPVALMNLKALLDRPCATAGYLPRPIKAQNETFQSLRRRHSYFGPVEVQVSDSDPITMLNLNDDQVASICFFFGRDAFEPLSLYLFSQIARTESSILDVGSYTGIFGLAAASANRSAQVVCVEPLPHIVDRVKVNAGLNGLTNLTVVNAAVSKTAGKQNLTLYGVSTATTGASLVAKPNGMRSVGTLEVTTITLSDLVSNAPNRIGLIKIDTEGAELDVFAGGAKILSEHRPIVLSEVLSDKAIADQVDAMKRFGYSAHFIDERKRALAPVDSRFSLRGYGYGNVVFCASDADIRRMHELAEHFASFPHEADH